MNRGAPTTRASSPGVVGRTVVIVCIMLTVALLHVFRVGSYLEGRLFSLYYSYFSDVVVPFGCYFLICLNEGSLGVLRDWRVRAGLVFAAASLTEVMQLFGVPLLGVTFDPLDIAMFGLGVSLAVIADRLLFVRVFPFWDPQGATRTDVSDE